MVGISIYRRSLSNKQFFADGFGRWFGTAGRVVIVTTGMSLGLYIALLILLLKIPGTQDTTSWCRRNEEGVLLWEWLVYGEYWREGMHTACFSFCNGIIVHLNLNCDYFSMFSRLPEWGWLRSDTSVWFPPGIDHDVRILIYMQRDLGLDRWDH